jgi:luciferase family oxidoreductase group 1
VLVAAIAGVTEDIRVGSGGVMLPHYSALKVAETFRLLEALHPGRIDLGIGRAPGGDPLTARALRPAANGTEEFPHQVQDLIGWLQDRLDPRHPYARVRAIPDPGEGRAPELWMLGSSDYGAMVAAHFGLAFSFAHFINPHVGPIAARAYRDRFTPSPALGAPRTGVGVGVICADTEAEARRLAQSVALWRLRLERGDPGPVPSVEEAEAHPYSDAERARVETMSARLIAGTPEQVRSGLLAVASDYGADELTLLSLIHDPAARIRSYELVAEAFALPGIPASRR